jgi:hypothetical protein
MKHNWMGDPTLDSTTHLLWLGTQNQRWNRDARQILAGRGESSVFLREYEKSLKSSPGKGGMTIQLDRDSIKPDSWLASTPTGKCCDCGKLTARTYNGGKYFQCGTCADGCRAVGRKEWHAQLEAKKRASIMKAASSPAAAPQVVTPTEIIPANEPSYETALATGTDAEAIKAAGNQEAAQAAYDAYTETKDTLTQLMSSLENAA